VELLLVVPTMVVVVRHMTTATIFTLPGKAQTVLFCCVLQHIEN
jgi:hypothetical protein